MDVQRCDSKSFLAVTLARIQEAHSESFDEVIEKDLITCQNLLQFPDFYEGARAALIDKDFHPHR
ncbi:MAG: enoyl-CoA hydratase/isomerase family protein [Coxiellaceae bacterium]|nr:enoyl-CoA hydratase/isomerase family protein [Coxiellaceae bacterium]